MIKIFLAIVISCTLYAGNYIVLSGYAYHFEKENIVGREYDSLIEGIGFQHRRPCGYFECSGTIMLLSDSNSKLMYTGTLGMSYNLFFNVNAGAEVGLGSKMVYGTSGDEVTSYSRHPIGVFMPKLELDFNRIIMNVGFIPGFKSHGVNIDQAIYINFGIKLSKEN